MGPNIKIGAGQIVLVDKETGDELKLGEFTEDDIEAELTTSSTGKPLLKHSDSGELTCTLTLTKRSRRRLRFIIWRSKLRLAWYCLTGK